MKIRAEIVAALELAMENGVEIWLGAITPTYAERQFIEGHGNELISKENGYWIRKK